MAIEKREKEVNEFIETLNIPNVVLFNRATNEKKSLQEMIKDKLYDALLEQECSNINYFEWTKEELLEAETVEDFTSILEDTYNNSGEKYSDESYSFFNEETEEDDYSDYSNK